MVTNFWSALGLLFFQQKGWLVKYFADFSLCHYFPRFFMKPYFFLCHKKLFENQQLLQQFTRPAWMFSREALFFNQSIDGMKSLLL